MWRRQGKQHSISCCGMSLHIASYPEIHTGVSNYSQGSVYQSKFAVIKLTSYSPSARQRSTQARIRRLISAPVKPEKAQKQATVTRETKWPWPSERASAKQVPEQVKTFWRAHDRSNGAKQIFFTLNKLFFSIGAYGKLLAVGSGRCEGNIYPPFYELFAFSFFSNWKNIRFFASFWNVLERIHDPCSVIRILKMKIWSQII